MSENKDYVSHVVENGSIHISDEVIASITAMAAQEVEGVYGMGGNINSELSKIAKMNPNKGVRLSLSKDDEISIDCYIVVLYGYSVIDVAKAVQETITSTVESTTGRKVRSVNVNISGISLPKSVKK